jgi:hypothetical protein
MTMIWRDSHRRPALGGMTRAGHNVLVNNGYEWTVPVGAGPRLVLALQHLWTLGPCADAGSTPATSRVEPARVEEARAGRGIRPTCSMSCVTAARILSSAT